MVLALGAERRIRMKLEITRDEATALVKVLEHYVSDLRMEVADTEQKDMRDALKVEEEALKRILQGLQAGLPQG